MTEVSSSTDSSIMDRYDTVIDCAKEQSEISNIEKHITPDDTSLDQTSIDLHNPQGSTTENEKMAKAAEDLHRALAPNLRNLDLEHDITLKMSLSDSPIRKFSLLTDLFKLKIQAFAMAGGSIEKFAEEVKNGDLNQEGILKFEGKQAGLKKEILETYMKIQLVIEEVKERILQYPYNSPFLQLFELERETGFVVAGTELLEKEWSAYNDVFSKLSKGFSLGLDAYNVKKFYWETLLPGTQKIFHYYEQYGKKEFLMRAVDSVRLYFFNPNLYKKFSIPDESKDPFSLLLSYIVKYCTLEQIKPYFNERFKTLPEWDRAYLWIDLECRAAEILAPIDLKKSHEYLDKAKSDQKSKLWAYSFSPNHTVIEEKAVQAAARIDECTLKCTKKKI